MAEKRSTEEKPLKLKAPQAPKSKPKKTPSLVCIIHYNHNKSDKKTRPLSEASFKKIQETVEFRQSRDSANERLDEICSQVPPIYYPHLHGYHRWCYQNFTNTSKLLKRKTPSGDDNEPCCSKRRRISEQSSTAILLPADKCLFCDKNRIRKQGCEEKLVKCVTKTAEQSIKKAAERKKDEHILLKVQDVDLIAREAHYHASCRKKFTRTPGGDYDKSDKDDRVKGEQTAHMRVFEYISQYVKESIIEGCNVERMTMLRERYLQFMLENSPQFYNADYKTYKLKAKLRKQFGSQIQFWQPNYKSELVYSAGVQRGQAVEIAFEIAASESKRLEEAAVLLRRKIQGAQNESQQMPWPPSAGFLLGGTIHPPECLQEFITHLITGKKMQDSHGKRERLVLSFAQDLCQAVTRGQWIMPKHLLLGMTLRHLTGSAEIVTLISRFGHCASYSSLLELETAICRLVYIQILINPTSLLSSLFLSTPRTL